MPTRNVKFDRLDRFVLAKVKRGRYENASEVVRAALQTLEREAQEYEAKLGARRAAVDEGDASGVARTNVFARVRKTQNLPTGPTGAYTLRTREEDQVARYVNHFGDVVPTARR